MKNLYLALLNRDDKIEIQSSPIIEETEESYILKYPIGDAYSISKKWVASSSGDFFAFGFTEKGALIKLIEKQEDKKKDIQNNIDKIRELI